MGTATFVNLAAVGPQRWVRTSASPRDSSHKPGWPEAHPSACRHALCPLPPLPLAAPAVPQGFLEPLQAVDGEWAVLAGLQEALHMRQEDVAGREEPCAQPEQLPAPLLTIPAGRGTADQYASAPHTAAHACPHPHPCLRTNTDPPP